MIRSLNDFSIQARERGPKRVAVLAPEDEDFMTAVKTGWSMGYIEPVLIGDIARLERAAEKTAVDSGGFEKISCSGNQNISDLGIGMLFSGDVPIASKGQIPTSHVYRSIIRGESAAASGMTVSVVSFWEIPGVDHLVAFTDTGVNIKPDARAKEEILRNPCSSAASWDIPVRRLRCCQGAGPWAKRLTRTGTTRAQAEGRRRLLR
jgi:phosphate butyryltransferase